MQIASRRFALAGALATAWVATAALAATPATAGRFIAPVTLPGVADMPLGADAAAAPDGTVIAVWTRVASGQSQVVASVRAPGGTFSAPSPVSPLGGRAPKLAIDGRGVATLVWQQRSPIDGSSSIQEVTRSAAGAFGPTITLSSGPDDSAFPEVAVNSQGTAIVAWEHEHTNTVIDAAARPAGADFGPSHQVSPAGATNAMFDPNVAVGEDGTGMVTWSRSNDTAEASRWTVSAGFDPAVRIAASDDFVSRPDVAIDAQGTAVFAYFGIEAGAQGVRVQTRTAGGTFSATSLLTSVPGTAGSRPDLSEDRAGNMLLTWDEHPVAAGNPVVIRAAARPSGQGFQGATVLSGELPAGTRRSQAITPAGDAIVAWIAAGKRIQARVKPRGTNVFGPLQNDFPVRTDITDVATFADGEGNLGALWRRTGAGDPGTVEVRAFDGAPPHPRGLSLPSGAVAGRPAALAAAFTDTWSPVSVGWAFGDGATGAGATTSHAYGPGTFTATATATDAAGNIAKQSGAFGVRALRPDEIDADGDGFSAALDCNDANPAIRPGAVEIPGNAVDENCDGIRAPFPRVTASVSLATLFFARSTELSTLRVVGLEGGETVRLSCKGRGCVKRVRAKVRIRHKTPLLKLDKHVRGVRLRKGAHVNVRISRPGFVAKLVRFTIRIGDAPGKVELCQAPGARKVGVC